MSEKNQHQEPEVVEQRSMSGLIFQSLESGGQFAGGLGGLLAGAAAWKHVGGKKDSGEKPAAKDRPSQK